MHYSQFSVSYPTLRLFVCLNKFSSFFNTACQKVVTEEYSGKITVLSGIGLS